MKFKKECILLAASLLLITLPPNACGQAAVSISPPVQNLSLFSSPTLLSVNVSISNVNYLYGYQYDVLCNQTILNITSSGITEGPFLKSGGVATFCITPVLSSPGTIKYIACARTGTTNVSGSGNLTRMTFNVSMSVAPTATRISIVNSKLSNIYSQAIAHTIANGTINLFACLYGEAKACGPSNIGECRNGTQACISSNDWGSCAGAVYPSAEICDNKDNDCDASVDETLSRACSTSHQGLCSIGTETCSAGAWAGCPSPIQEICYNGIDEDCDGSDSACKGDVNGDHCIDIQDMAAVALDFGKTSGFINPNSDIDKNGIVDIFDLVYVGKDFGVGCT